MANKKTEEEKKESKNEVKPEAVSEPKASQGLTYAETLEARAQRGSMTHQKRFAMKQAKEKEMRGE